MIKLPKMVTRDLFSEFGNPADSGFKEKIAKQMIETNLPVGLNKGETTKINCHRVIEPALIDALKEIAYIFGADNMRTMDIDRYHGCHNIRPVSGYPGHWSIHSWACAIDLNAHLGAMGAPSVMPYQFVKAFKDRGFYWGGEWNRQDGMHFSLVNG